MKRLVIVPSVRIIRESVLTPVLEGYLDYLTRRGYASLTRNNYLASVAHFARWLSLESIELRRIDEDLVRRFLSTHLPICRCPRPAACSLPSVRRALRLLVRVMRSTGRIQPKPDSLCGAIRQELERFDIYLADVCGHATATRLYRLRYVREFLVAQFPNCSINLSRLKPADICRFVTRRAQGLKPRTAGIIGDCLRSYFRFAAVQGHATERLIAAVPRVAHWRLASLPGILTESELNNVLSCFDRATATGRRDYAMARCLVDLGLRASEVASLQLDDVNWREGTLRIAKAKSKRVTLLPLPARTGQALAQYLRFARPNTTTRAIFVRHRAPRDEPVGASLVRNAMRCAYARCQLDSRWTGTHVLRRTTASRLINAGATMKDIADLLRHRDLDTTTIYAKVDLHKLAKVALPWPDAHA
jgi:integrase/recombinase XerD